MVHQRQGQYTEARRCYEQSLAIRRELGDQSEVAHSLGQLGVLLGDSGEHVQAVGLLVQALAMLEALGSPSRRTIADYLSRLHAKMGHAAFGDALRQAGFEVKEEA
jgi:tetratricopeptide (TPR) repeat protein